MLPVTCLGIIKSVLIAIELVSKFCVPILVHNFPVIYVGWVSTKEDYSAGNDIQGSKEELKC